MGELMRISVDDLSHPKVHDLLREHLAGMNANSPPGQVFALDFTKLQVPEITFWTAWDSEDLLGCGAIKELRPTQGEIKSMRTSAAHLRRGVGKEILRVILQEACRRGYAKVSLETGSSEAFLPAHALYEGAGFSRCGPFGDYQQNGFSVFMEKELKQPNTALDTDSQASRSARRYTE
jgi:putative acetyltransferase